MNRGGARKLSMSSEANPARRNNEAVSRSRQQPSKKKCHGRRANRCPQRRRPSGATTCSTNTNRPPGRSTRCTSATTAAGSATLHNTSVATTRSTLPSSRSRFSAPPRSQIELDAPALGDGPQASMHGDRGLEGHQSGTGQVVAQVGARTGTELDDVARRIAEQSDLASTIEAMHAPVDARQTPGVEPAAQGRGTPRRFQYERFAANVAGTLGRKGLGCRRFFGRARSQNGITHKRVGVVDVRTVTPNAMRSYHVRRFYGTLTDPADVSPDSKPSTNTKETPGRAASRQCRRTSEERRADLVSAAYRMGWNPRSCRKPRCGRPARPATPRPRTVRPGSRRSGPRTVLGRRTGCSTAKSGVA